MKNIKDILEGIEAQIIRGPVNRPLSGIFLNSTKIKKDGCFVAITGFRDDGNKYITDAVNNGAVMVVSEMEPLENFPDVTWVQLKNIRKAFSRMSMNFYESPFEGKYVIGVTGTNGKTSVVSLIDGIFSKVSETARAGTLGMFCGQRKSISKLTTPELNDICRFLSEECPDDLKNIIMEVSSVALELDRVNGINFSQAVFTNLSGDHLDFHSTMENYFNSKLSLFKGLPENGWAIINIDDKKGSEIIDNINSRYLTYGFSSHADVRPDKYKLDINGIKADIDTPRGKISINSSLIGRVNLMNILAAVASAIAGEMNFDSIRKAIEEVKAVRGRLDFVYKNNFSVLIDYAHTDKALESLLLSVKELEFNRLILVFGAGGSRDKTKRARMGKVASEHADIVIVTSDNPRNEDPGSIIDQIIGGFSRGFKNYYIEIDREKGIGKGIEMAGKKDIVIIAGKGHEDYQIFKEKTIHFDDYEMVKNIIGRNNA